MYGGVAMWSIGKAAHHIVEKGNDPSELGRWAWVRYKGQKNHSLRVYTAYRPALPQGGCSRYMRNRERILANKMIAAPDRH